MLRTTHVDYPCGILIVSEHLYLLVLELVRKRQQNIINSFQPMSSSGKYMYQSQWSHQGRLKNLPKAASVKLTVDESGKG